MKTNTKIKKYFSKNTPPSVKNFFGFTIVELLVSISILATISIVAYVSFSGHVKVANNATRISTIDSLHLSLSDYYQLKKTLPEPNSNYIAYDERGTYMHSLSGAYGVSGYVSNNFLPAGYVNFEATDPESKQFYGYGKTLDAKSATFDVAAALYDDKTGSYKTYIRGTYEKQRLTSLIRAYSSSNFVSQDSTEDLPYNPYERKVSAHVSSFSGTLVLKNSNGLFANLSSPQSYTGELNSGDTITLGTGSTALVHISDGSDLSLGSTTSQTELKLDTLAYSDDNNLSSKVSLLLNAGEIWTEAPHLRTETDSSSDFSVQTDSAVAAVRGTIFGVAKAPATKVTTISLKVGKIQVDKLDTNGNKIPFNNGFVIFATGGFVSEYTPGIAPKSYMIVPEEGTPLKLDNITNELHLDSPIPTSTGSIIPSEIDQKIQHPPFSLGYRPMADKISFIRVPDTLTGILSVAFQNHGADSYELYFGTGLHDSAGGAFNKPDIAHPSYTGSLSSTGSITLTGAFVYISGAQVSRVYSLRVCKNGHCSAPDIKHFTTETFDFGPFKVWGEKKKLLVNNDDAAGPACGNTIQGICEPNLVAYASYDTSVDIYGTGGILGGTNSGYLDDVNADASLTYYKFNSNKFIDGTYSLSENNRRASNIEDAGLSSLGFPVSREPNIGIYTWGSYGKGIFIDNDNAVGGNDFLKYNLTPLGLGTNFSIEISVRGAALKRYDGINSYVLASGGASVYLGSSTNFLLFLHSNGDLKLCNGGSCSSITQTNISGLGLDNNTFYTVQYKKQDSSPGTFSILPSIGQPGKSVSVLSNYPFINPDADNSGKYNLFIGSKKSSQTQWNDIIDSVKIYKN